MKAPWTRRAEDAEARADEARQQAERVQHRRSEVEALAATLRYEQHLNNFTANIVATFRGGR